MSVRVFTSVIKYYFQYKMLEFLNVIQYFLIVHVILKFKNKKNELFISVTLCDFFSTNNCYWNEKPFQNDYIKFDNFVVSYLSILVN